MKYLKNILESVMPSFFKAMRCQRKETYMETRNHGDSLTITYYIPDNLSYSDEEGVCITVKQIKETGENKTLACGTYKVENGTISHKYDYRSA